jgi:ABC-type multidrug transport system fused ATPase/permease subunit
MENGRIVEMGTHNQLLEQSGRYKELVNTQNILS